MAKYLFLLEQSDNHDYDAIVSCIVCAPNDVFAKMIHPFSDIFFNENKWHGLDENKQLWTRRYWSYSVDKVECTLIGVANDDMPIGKVILYTK